MSTESKLYQLLKCLNDLEIKRFRNVIKKGHSPERLVLLEILLKSLKAKQEEPDKSLVYEKVFKQKYSKDKDYLIRNEYRLISDDLEAFLANNPIDFDSELRLQLNYLKRLLLAGNYHLFLIEKQQSIKRFGAHPHLFADLEWMEESYASRFRLMNPDMIYEYVSKIENLERNMNGLNEFYKSEIQLRKSYAERVLRGYAIKDTVKLEEIKEISEEFNADIEYNRLKSKQFQQFGLERIKTLKKMEEILPKCKFLFKKEQFFSAASIPLEWMLAGNYKESILAYEKAMKIEGFDKSSVFLSGALFNYLSVLNKVGEFKKFEELHSKYSNYIESSPYQFRTALLRAMVLLNMENYRKARSVMRDVKLEDKSSDYFYLKVLFICCLIGEGNLVSAQNDLDNFNRLIKANNASKNYHYAAYVLKHAIKWKENPSEANLQKLHNAISEEKNDPEKGHDLSPIRWVAKISGYKY